MIKDFMLSEGEDDVTDLIVSNWSITRSLGFVPDSV